MRRRNLGETFFLYYHCDDVLIAQDITGDCDISMKPADLGSICLSITF